MQNADGDFAFSQALVGESISDDLAAKYDQATDTFNGVTNDDLDELAKVVAYKVYHNVKNGYELDPDDDPLVVPTDGGEVPAAKEWEDHYAKVGPDGMRISELIGRLEDALERMGDVIVVNTAHMQGLSAFDEAGDHVEIE